MHRTARRRQGQGCLDTCLLSRFVDGLDVIMSCMSTCDSSAVAIQLDVSVTHVLDRVRMIAGR